MVTYRNSVKDKRILLTGGTTGIGRATLALLVSEGARVVTFGRNDQPLDESLENARSGAGDSGGEVFGLTADVSTREGIARVFAAVDEHLGGLDILVANAALGAEPVHEMPEDDWRYVIETNLVGYLSCAKAAMERMEGQGGQLLFVSSISTDIKKPGESVYAASKAGIKAFAETLRKEVQGKGIKVSVIQPGSVNTPMQECSDADKAQAVSDREMLEPEEIAEAILFSLTRSARADVVNLRIEPLLQKTS